MSVLASADTESIPLSSRSALAARLLRGAGTTRDFYGWLVCPKQMGAYCGTGSDRAIKAVVDELLAPLRESSTARQRRELENAGSWLSAVFRHIHQSCIVYEVDLGPHWLATGLLPLYRSLATGDAQEGFSQTRFRLLESLCWIGLCQELGDDFVAIFREGASDQHPNTLLTNRFQVDLAGLTAMVHAIAADYDPDLDQFSPYAQQAMQSDAADSEQKLAEWAKPDLLWRLADELVSRKSDLVLPRSWIETPVPWKSVSEHWVRLQRLLSRDPAYSGNGQIAIAGPPTSPSAGQPTAVALGGLGHELGSSGTGDEFPESASDTSARTPEPSQAETPSAGSATLSDAADETAGDGLFHSKVLIAEIHTHNDPAFVNVLSRQIVHCRADERSLALASIVVRAETSGAAHSGPPQRPNTLSRWQQALVAWLANHPEVIDPHAFVTTDGELLLSFLDLERNEATSLLREGLLAILGGRPLDSESTSSLAMVPIPARYHAGIAICGKPSAAFKPNKLIEATIDCRAAAGRQGKASIKSIEVF